jgi:hypothetical protein
MSKLAILLWSTDLDRPDLAAAPFVYAAAACALDAEVEVHFAGRSVRLLVDGAAEGRQAHPTTAAAVSTPSCRTLHMAAPASLPAAWPGMNTRAAARPPSRNSKARRAQRHSSRARLTQPGERWCSRWTPAHHHTDFLQRHLTSETWAFPARPK